MGSKLQRWASILTMTTVLASGPALAASVDAEPTAGTVGLILDGEGSSQTRIVKIADLTLGTADARGCTVWVSSGILVRVGGTPIPFQVAIVAHAASPPPAASFTVPPGAT